jgi:hypothetical protein
MQILANQHFAIICWWSLLVDPSINQLVDQIIHPSIDRSIHQSIDTSLRVVPEKALKIPLLIDTRPSPHL